MTGLPGSCLSDVLPPELCLSRMKNPRSCLSDEITPKSCLSEAVRHDSGDTLARPRNRAQDYVLGFHNYVLGRPISRNMS